MFITVTAGYPETIPDVIISGDGLSRQRCAEIRDTLLAHSVAFLGRPMLFDMIQFIQEHLQGFTST